MMKEHQKTRKNTSISYKKNLQKKGTFKRKFKFVSLLQLRGSTQDGSHRGLPED